MQYIAKNVFAMEGKGSFLSLEENKVFESKKSLRMNNAASVGTLPNGSLKINNMSSLGSIVNSRKGSFDPRNLKI